MGYDFKVVTYEATGEMDVFLYSRPVEKVANKRKVDYDRIKRLRELDVMMPRSILEAQRRAKKDIYDYARANVWEWFWTMTGDSRKVDRYDYVAFGRKITQWMNNVRKRKAPELKYLVVPERHKDGAWHFHALVSNVGMIDMVDSGIRTKDGEVIYNVGDYRLGFTTATRIRDTLRASQYVTKYITKELVVWTKGKRRYWPSQNLERGKVETEYIGDEGKQAIRDFYGETAKRVKKIEVQKSDFNQRIDIYTL